LRRDAAGTQITEPKLGCEKRMLTNEEALRLIKQNAEGQIRLGYPNRVHVLTRKRVASDFEAVVKSLRTICEAAVQIGNPITWR
jgi:hypothetical protein